uniref:Glycosylphosphatidylinositol anchor attachment 1 protein n=1 Tax=Toxoplasma gondii TaxID=5811 RepID=Q53HX0_TOXGO|nr:glycosylphosphatidylinositol anchor attachment 1 protein [Toxoplasma gondii]
MKTELARLKEEAKRRATGSGEGSGAASTLRSLLKKDCLPLKDAQATAYPFLYLPETLFVSSCEQDELPISSFDKGTELLNRPPRFLCRLLHLFSGAGLEVYLQPFLLQDEGQSHFTDLSADTQHDENVICGTWVFTSFDYSLLHLPSLVASSSSVFLQHAAPWLSRDVFFVFSQSFFPRRGLLRMAVALEPDRLARVLERLTRSESNVLQTLHMRDIRGFLAAIALLLLAFACIFYFLLLTFVMWLGRRINAQRTAAGEGFPASLGGATVTDPAILWETPKREKTEDEKEKLREARRLADALERVQEMERKKKEEKLVASGSQEQKQQAHVEDPHKEEEPEEEDEEVEAAWQPPRAPPPLWLSVRGFCVRVFAVWIIVMLTLYNWGLSAFLSCLMVPMAWLVVPLGYRAAEPPRPFLEENKQDTEEKNTEKKD